MRAWWLIVSLLLVGACHAGERVDATTLARQIEDGQVPQVLDVRTESEFAAGHVPGAKLIPHGQLAGRLAELDASRPVVVYCRSGRRADIAEGMLREHGYEVTQLEGSWLAWDQAGLPVACPASGCASQAKETE